MAFFPMKKKSKAIEVDYSNTTSSLNASEVQTAIDLINTKAVNAQTTATAAYNKFTSGTTPKTAWNQASQAMKSNNRIYLCWSNDGYIEVWVDVTCVLRIKGYQTIN